MFFVIAKAESDEAIQFFFLVLDCFAVLAMTPGSVLVVHAAWNDISGYPSAVSASALAPPGAPFYQVWAAPLVLAAIAVAGLGYLALAAPHRRVPETAM